MDNSTNRLRLGLRFLAEKSSQIDNLSRGHPNYGLDSDDSTVYASPRYELMAGKSNVFERQEIL